MESCPKDGPDGPLFQYLDRGRQRPGAQDNGQVPSLLHGEGTCDAGPPAADLFLNDGCGGNDAVQHDGQLLLHIGFGDALKDAPPLLVEFQRNIGGIVLMCRSEPGRS